MHYGQADYLLYGFVQDAGGVEVHLIDFPKLRAWFWPHLELFERFKMNGTLNETAGRKVPVQQVRQALPTWVLHIPVPERALEYIGVGP
jgi:hypothetical protein